MTPEIRALLRFRNALSSWHIRLFNAARQNKPFTEKKPEPQDFKPSRPWTL